MTGPFVLLATVLVAWQATVSRADVSGNIFDAEGPPRMSHQPAEEAVQALLCETCHTMLYHSFEHVWGKRKAQIAREELGADGPGEEEDKRQEGGRDGERHDDAAGGEEEAATRGELSLEEISSDLNLICHPHLAPGMYLRKTDIVSDGAVDDYGRGFVRLARQKQAGRCEVECATMASACEILRNDLVSMADVAIALWEGREDPHSIVARHCGDACRFYEPGALPDSYEFEDVPFVPLAAEDLVMDVMQALSRHGRVNWDDDAGAGGDEDLAEYDSEASLSQLDHVEDSDEIPEEYRLTEADMDLLRKFQMSHGGADHVDVDRKKLRDLIDEGTLPAVISFLLDNTGESQETVRIDLRFLKNAENAEEATIDRVEVGDSGGSAMPDGGRETAGVGFGGDQCGNDADIVDEDGGGAQGRDWNAGDDDEFTLTQRDIDMLRDLRSEHGLADSITLPSEEVASLVAQGRLPAAFKPPPGMKAAAEISIDLSIVSHFDNADMTFGEFGSHAPPGIASDAPLGVDW